MHKSSPQKSRWGVAAAAVVIQLCLGTVYAWSVFKNPLMAAHGWTETATQITFMICICACGICAAFGGALLDKKGPRFVAASGGTIFGLGTIITAYAGYAGNIWLLYLGYGFVAGAGNGLAYVTPIATLIRWFPDKRGLVTGLAVMGFGAGAFFMGQIAPTMIIKLGVTKTWFISGLVFLLIIPGMAQFLKNPPLGWLPVGFIPKSALIATAKSSWTFAEAGFKALKSNLGLRPNPHQKEDRVEAHVFICVLAYHLLRNILWTLEQKGDYRDWETLKRILRTHCYTTIMLPTRNGQMHRIRKAGQPEECQKAIYRNLGITWDHLPSNRSVIGEKHVLKENHGRASTL